MKKNLCRICPKDSFAWNRLETFADTKFCWIIIYMSGILGNHFPTFQRKKESKEGINVGPKVQHFSKSSHRLATWDTGPSRFSSPSLQQSHRRHHLYPQGEIKSVFFLLKFFLCFPLASSRLLQPGPLRKQVLYSCSCFSCSSGWSDVSSGLWRHKSTSSIVK